MGKEKSFDDIMTLAETAVYLKLSKNTVYQYAQKGKLPAFKVGTPKHGKWRFSRKAVEEFIGKGNVIRKV